MSEKFGVYELLGEGKRQFFTSGINSEGGLLGCLASQPRWLMECEANGRLLHVFFDQTTAQSFSDKLLPDTVIAENVEQIEKSQKGSNLDKVHMIVNHVND